MTQKRLLQVVTQQAPDNSVGGGRTVRSNRADLPDVPADRSQLVFILEMGLFIEHPRLSSA